MTTRAPGVRAGRSRRGLSRSPPKAPCPDSTAGKPEFDRGSKAAIAPAPMLGVVLDLMSLDPDDPNPQLVELDPLPEIAEIAEIAAFIWGRRLAFGLSLADLAELAGVDLEAVAVMERVLMPRSRSGRAQTTSLPSCAPSRLVRGVAVDLVKRLGRVDQGGRRLEDLEAQGGEDVGVDRRSGRTGVRGDVHALHGESRVDRLGKVTCLTASAGVSPERRGRPTPVPVEDPPALQCGSRRSMRLVVLAARRRRKFVGTDPQHPRTQESR